jgi:hypothetical protein
MSRNFGFRTRRKYIEADDFSLYAGRDVVRPFYVIVALTLLLVGIGIFIA